MHRFVTAAGQAGWGIVGALVMAWCQPAIGWSEQPTIFPASIQPRELSDEEVLRSVEWLASFALDRVPRVIDGDDAWGNTKRVWAGVKLRIDGGKLKTKRRWRDLEHGRWARYKIKLPKQSAARRPKVTIDDVAAVKNPQVGDQSWKIDSTIVLPMEFQVQIQRWSLGIKLYSVTVEGRMRVRLKSSATLGMITDITEIPPALVFDPQIQRARLSLESFEVDRVSHIGGDAAESWGEMAQELIVETYLQYLNRRLVGKLNRAIVKERDELRISLSEWLGWQGAGSPWSGATGKRERTTSAESMGPAVRP